jgi:uncharacterized protein YjbI with pentapeptide repeats
VRSCRNCNSSRLVLFVSCPQCESYEPLQRDVYPTTEDPGADKPELVTVERNGRTLECRICGRPDPQLVAFCRECETEHPIRLIRRKRRSRVLAFRMAAVVVALVVVISAGQAVRLTVESIELSRFDLSGKSFNRRNLANKDLSDRDLTNTDLRGANLSGANLSGANLSGADLSGANLSGANLQSAFLATSKSGRATRLDRANLSSANLIRANLVRASAVEANFDGAVLIDAKLSVAQLDGANFRNALMRRALLGRASLRGADLTGADLTEGNLADAFLTDTAMTRASLVGADLTNASLVGADLSGVQLKQSTMGGVIGLSDTELARILATDEYHLPFVVSERGIRFESREQIRARAIEACRGSPIRDARRPSADGGFRYTVVVAPGDSVFAFEIPEWEPPAIRFTEQIACVEDQQESRVQRCSPYVNEQGRTVGSVDRYRYSVSVRLIEAATGEPVTGSLRVTGPQPRACQYREQFSHAELENRIKRIGDPVGPDQIRDAIGAFVGSPPSSNPSGT